MSKKVLNYGVMFGAFSPIVKRDFDIAARIMELKNLDGIIFAPTSLKIDDEYGVENDDKITLIKLAAQDYVDNVYKKDTAFMTCDLLFNKDLPHRNVKYIMSLIDKTVEESNIHNKEFYIKHTPILEHIELSFVISEEPNDPDVIIYNTNPNAKYLKNVLHMYDLKDIHKSASCLHRLLKSEMSIPKGIWIGDNHKNFYLNMCIKNETQSNITLI